MLNQRFNHQVVGAREPITLFEGDKVHEFLMSPLSDLDLSEIDLWVQCEYLKLFDNSEVSESERERAKETAESISAWSGEGSQLVSTPRGAARILWQCIHKSHSDIPYSKIQFFAELFEDDRNKLEFNAKVKALNSTSYAVNLPKSDKPQQPPNKAVVYCVLADMYGYTFAEIAAMTPLQQLVAISKGKNNGSTEMYFDTEEDYMKWLATRNK